MAQQVEVYQSTTRSKASKLPAILAGDITAAAVSATLISPILTAIDRAVVENAASNSRPLAATLRTHILCSFRYPRLYFVAKPFFYIWTLYAATYTTANGVHSIGTAFTEEVDHLLVSSITFATTCLVNVPLGVWKDVRFVETFGRGVAPTVVSSTATASGTHLKDQRPVAPPAKFPRVVGATFLLRDAITILGSFTLPTMVSTSIPNTLLSDPAARMAAAQLFVPVLSQVVATPIHLLGLDLYTNSTKGEKGERAKRITRNLGPATVMRCCRVIPAFGVGGIVNGGLREWFHRLVGGKVQR